MIFDNRGTFALIDIDNYLQNLEYINKKTNTKIMPVLKADAYGHGSKVLAKHALKEGYERFAVAFLDEAVELIKNGIKKPILVFNYFNPEMMKYIDDYSEYIIPTISSLEFLEKILYYSGKNIRKFKFHLNYNTGINRIGLNDYEIDEILRKIKEKNIKIEGIYSHFATADEDDEFIIEQFKEFKNFENYLNSKHINFSISHISNSAASLFHPEMSLDFVRPGIATYGLQPSSKKQFKELKPVMTLISTISKINNVKKGDTIGYGRTYKTNKDINTAIIPIGYADGIFRNLSNKTFINIKGKKCEIIGNISMDQMVVNLNDLNAKTGDKVIIFGEYPTANEHAEKANTINYEITSKITKRIKRIYKKGGKYIE
ncbi:alanine racemase [Oceanotoga sp. DSM 15011]|uniref:alanine racemase n=1 Tax=Oceanotoga TaxID=1255275 RepID=UPI0021F4994E|nr:MULTISPECIES: alanine racemase [Oceanotoga]MDO7977380.1 alanine racemase [Oceanotoga teriensis]UYP00403.1 alanine racemase [Oceanotoga sp. DSM 15011]